MTTTTTRAAERLHQTTITVDCDNPDVLAALVLARPVPVPEVETERVDWRDVVPGQRRLKGLPDVRIDGVRFNGGNLTFMSDGRIVALVMDPAIGWDGTNTVEVLVEGGGQSHG